MDDSQEQMNLSVSADDEEPQANSSLEDVKEALQDCGSICINTTDELYRLQRPYSDQAKETMSAEDTEKITTQELKFTKIQLDGLKRSVEKSKKNSNSDIYDNECKRLKLDLNTKVNEMKKMESKLNAITDEDNKTETELLIFERNELLDNNAHLQERLEQAEKKIHDLESALTKSRKDTEEPKHIQQDKSQTLMNSNRVRELEGQLRDIQVKHDELTENLKTVQTEKNDILKRFNEKCAELDRMENQNRKLQASYKELSEKNNVSAKLSLMKEAKLPHIPKDVHSKEDDQIDSSLTVSTDTNNAKSVNGDSNCEDECASSSKILSANESKLTRADLVAVNKKILDSFRGALKSIKEEVVINNGNVRKLFNAFESAKIKEYVNDLATSRQVLTEKYDQFVSRQMKILQQFSDAVKTLDGISEEIKNEKTVEIESLNEKLRYYESQLDKLKTEQSSKDVQFDMKAILQENEYFRDECCSKQLAAAELAEKVVRLENQLATMQVDWDDDKQELADAKAELASLREQIQGQPSSSNDAPYEMYAKFAEFWRQQQNPKP